MSFNNIDDELNIIFDFFFWVLKEGILNAANNYLQDKVDRKKKKKKKEELNSIFIIFLFYYDYRTYMKTDLCIICLLMQIEENANFTTVTATNMPYPLTI